MISIDIKRCEPDKQHQKGIFKLVQSVKKIIDCWTAHVFCCNRRTCGFKTQITRKQEKLQLCLASLVFEGCQIMNFYCSHTLAQFSSKSVRDILFFMVNLCSSETCYITYHAGRNSGYLAIPELGLVLGFNRYQHLSVSIILPS